MFRRIALVTLVLLAACAAVSFAEPAKELGTEENPIVWAFVPSVDTARVSAGSQAVAELLFKSTGLYFKTFIATDYVGVIEAMKAKPTKAHMASLATAAYILAADLKVAEAALVSVRNGTAFYKGQIITRPDTGIKKLADIKGRTFARVDPLSASGWIIPSLMLKGAGIDLDKDIKVVDAGGHPAVVTAVYSGQADAGACFVDARAQVAEGQPRRDGEGHRHPGVGQHPQRRRAVPPLGEAQELRAKIVDALLALIKTDEGKAAINNAYQWTGAGEARRHLLRRVPPGAAGRRRDGRSPDAEEVSGFTPPHRGGRGTARFPRPLKRGRPGMLEVQNLTKVYPDGTVALKDVSFTVQPGEFLVIIGLSGSGKSTLLRCINRLIDPTEGRILWDGVDVTAAEGEDLRRSAPADRHGVPAVQPGEALLRAHERARGPARATPRPARASCTGSPRPTASWPRRRSRGSASRTRRASRPASSRAGSSSGSASRGP